MERTATNGGQRSYTSTDGHAVEEGGGMKDLPDNELIKLYIKAAANESGDLPFGAEARRKEAGDELLARGITEIRLPAFVDPFPVKGSDVGARKCATVFSRSGR